MEPNDLELLLRAGLDLSGFTTPAHVASLDPDPDLELSNVAGVGVDTNILKQLRREPLKADTIATNLKSAKVPLLVPEQCIVEYWNNHQTFAQDGLTSSVTAVKNASKSLEKVSGAEALKTRLDAVLQQVEDIRLDLEDSSSADYLVRSTDVMTTLLEYACVPRISRERYADLAEARLRSKTPPGFADLASKSLPLGDVFAWFEFLFGVLELTSPKSDHTGGEPFVWATDDSKPDWKTNGRGHPALVAEGHRVTGRRIVVVDFRTLERLVSPPIVARDGDPDDQ